VLKIAAKHAQREALELLAKEIAPSATSMAQGITGFAAGRPSPSQVVRLFSCLIDAARLSQRVCLDGQDIGFVPQSVGGALRVKSSEISSSKESALGSITGSLVRLPLLRIAHARSGDKGDSANIGVIARSPAAYDFLCNWLTPERVHNYFAHLVLGEVHRYQLPGFGAFNFVMTKALGGGGVASLRYDPQGKAFAQMLLDLDVDVPEHVLESLP
jgi:hypothetical protein